MRLFSGLSFLLAQSGDNYRTIHSCPRAYKYLIVGDFLGPSDAETRKSRRKRGWAGAWRSLREQLARILPIIAGAWSNAMADAGLLLRYFSCADWEIRGVWLSDGRASFGLVFARLLRAVAVV